MSQTLLILSELFLLGILAWYCSNVESANIEADLSYRSAAALGYAGLDWLDIAVDGQDITLSGDIVSDDQRMLALESVANIWGVNHIHDALQKREAPIKPAAQPTLPNDNSQSTRLAPAAAAGQTLTHCQRTLASIIRDHKLQFSRGSSQLTENPQPVLERITKLLQQCPNTTLHISGHTDSIGRAEDNLALSQARAEAVAKALTKLGAASQRLRAIGKGESEPIADNTTTAGREANRRITFELESKSGDNLGAQQQ